MKNKISYYRRFTDYYIIYNIGTRKKSCFPVLLQSLQGLMKYTYTTQSVKRKQITKSTIAIQCLRLVSIADFTVSRKLLNKLFSILYIYQHFIIVQQVQIKTIQLQFLIFKTNVLFQDFLEFGLGISIRKWPHKKLKVSGGKTKTP